MKLSVALDTPLIEFPSNEGMSYWTVREAVEGVQIFGGIGSGKTSGSGRMLALKYLANGFGGLVLTAKPDEKALWEDYCLLTNRLHDLVVIEPGGQHRFNFLQYESSSSNSGGSITDNLVQVLKTVIRASDEKSEGKKDDQFWETALDMTIFNVVDLCMLAFGEVSIQDMYDIMLSAPKKEEKEENAAGNPSRRNAFKKAFEAAQAYVNQQIDRWQEDLTSEELAAIQNPSIFEQEILEAIPDARLLRFVDQFFIETYRNLSDKTRSIVEFSFLGFLFRLLRDPIYSLFCRYASTISPEDTLNGKIILLNLPVKTYHKVGRDSQILFKYIWQRAMEKRDVQADGKPVFLWADEAQNFLHEYDAEYQATARSSRIATVYLTQNLPNYHANMGGTKSEYRVKSFLGTLATKIFHANADLETNVYASNLIGEAYMEDHTRTSTISGSFSVSKGLSFKLEKVVRPEQLVSLRTGGPLNNYKVSGYMHRQGNAFSDGLNFKQIVFNQNYNP